MYVGARVAGHDRARHGQRDEAESREDGPAATSYRLYHYRFLKAASDIDPNLWDHDRYDVLTGVVWRILRIAAHVVANPVL